MTFLGSAICFLQWQPLEGIPGIGTNGENVYYDPTRAIAEYKAKTFNRSFLHMVMHCLFNHLFNISHLNPRLWDLSCDIAVEGIILDLDFDFGSIAKDDERLREIAELRRRVDRFTADKLYGYLRSGVYNASKLEELESLFRRDNHYFWHEHDAPEGEGGSDDGESEDDGDSGNDQEDGSGSEQKDGGEYKKPGKSVDEEKDESWKIRGSRGAAQDFWERAGLKAEIELKEFYQGNIPDSLMQQLDSIDNDHMDYTEFLRKFMINSEEMQVNDDEFDYIFYTYGLGLYKKMPLIEPLEYKEIKRVKDFAIAVDTSASCSGNLVKKFISKTYSMLKCCGDFEKVNIHVIQCDAKIQKDTVLSCKEDFEQLAKGFKLYGYGGTDFRPVFEYVDKLIAKGEFTDLQGIIYFTDGYGDFPETPPNYKTAFVFAEKAHNSVPSWAMEFELDEEDLNKDD
jgi:predicted metal-dependent peptidase